MHYTQLTGSVFNFYKQNKLVTGAFLSVVQQEVALVAVAIVRTDAVVAELIAKHVEGTLVNVC